MRRQAVTNKANMERMEKDMRRKTRKKHSSEDKIRIVPEGLRGPCTNNQVVPLRWGGSLGLCIVDMHMDAAFFNEDVAWLREWLGLLTSRF